MLVNGPVVIGGTGGSGTRVYHRLCSLAGFDMGRLNARKSDDSLPLAKWFFPKWTDPFIKKEMSPVKCIEMRMHLKLLLRLTHPFRNRPWGWKNARNLYLLPFFNEVYPEMRFLHVLRDGRDCAFNPKFPYRMHESCFLNQEERSMEDGSRKALHWARLNVWAEEYAKKHMPGRYLQCRLEDLCMSPQTEVQRIYGFLGVEDPQAIARGIAEIHPKSTMGRWHEAPAQDLARVEQTIGSELEHFGYALSLRQAI